MKLIIAEKKDQAKKLAAPFNHEEKHYYFELLPCDTFPHGAYIAWAAGHIIELVEPEVYDVKYAKWTLNDLPIQPSVFKYQVIKRNIHLFNTIKELLASPKVTEVICGTDPAREGSLIFYNVYHFLSCRKPVKRLWTSSLTEAAVKEAFTNLLDESDKYNLYEEAFSRSIADWLIGISLTRAYTIRMNQKKYDHVFSIGRVQTSLLKLIVDRYNAIENFIPAPYYEVYAQFNINDKLYKGMWYSGKETSIQEVERANKLATYCQGKSCTVEKVEQVEQIEYAPHLYALSDIQMEANQKFKIAITDIDAALQDLYLKGHISYPRSDSRFLTTQDALMVPDILQSLKQVPNYAELIPEHLPSIVDNKRYTDNDRVIDHYAIIITDNIPNFESLTENQRLLYDMIAKRLIAIHYEPAKYVRTRIHTYIADTFSFITKGRATLQIGWRAIYQNGSSTPENEDDDSENTEIPLLNEGESGVVTSTESINKMTKPPSKLREGDLIPLMKYAGRDLVEEQALTLKKVNGLGTEATRSNIIQTLKTRNYIQIIKNIVVPTTVGKWLIKAVGTSDVASASLTAEWESKLALIGEGKYNKDQFLSEVIESLHKLLIECEESVTQLPINTLSKDELTRAAAPNVQKQKKSSSNQEATQKNNPSVKEASHSNHHKPAAFGNVSTIDTKEGTNTSDSSVTIFEGVTIRNEVEERRQPASVEDHLLGQCPECEVGSIVDRNTFYGCTSFKMGCRFTLNKNILGKELTPTMIKDLLMEGQTSLIHGFKKKNKDEFFDAVLELKERKISFKFPDRNALKLPTDLLLVDRADKAISEEQKVLIKKLIQMCEALKLNSTLKGLVNSPQISRFELQPNNMNVNMKKFANYKANFQMALTAEKIAIQIPIPGTDLIGIEVPSPTPYTVNLRSMLEDKGYLARKEPLSFPVGVDLHGNNVFADIAKMPHCLIAGATNSGKSVCINSIIVSLIYANTPEELKFIFVDPKRVELTMYAEIPHLMQPVITDMKETESTLAYVLEEMDNRYELMKDLRVKTFNDYNTKVMLESTGLNPLPHIVIIIDEFGSLMLQSENTSIPDIITRLVQEARAAGIHLILSTQRPVAKVFPPTIKANLPARIVFAVSSTTESMVALDEPGAENLLGMGDMLFKTNRGIKRLVSAYISDAEINRVVSYTIMKYGRNSFCEI